MRNFPRHDAHLHSLAMVQALPMIETTVALLSASASGLLSMVHSLMLIVALVVHSLGLVLSVRRALVFHVFLVRRPSLA